MATAYLKTEAGIVKLVRHQHHRSVHPRPMVTSVIDAIELDTIDVVRVDGRELDWRDRISWNRRRIVDPLAAAAAHFARHGSAGAAKLEYHIASVIRSEGANR